MEFKVSFAIFVISLILTQSVAVSDCLKSESDFQTKAGITGSDQPTTTTTISPLIAALSTESLPPTATPTKVSTKSGQETEEELMQKLRMYLSLLDQHIKLTGRPRFGRSVPLVLPIV